VAAPLEMDIMSMDSLIRTRNAFADMDERSREVFRHIVDSYMESGDPVGSRTISRRLPSNLSPATIRNVMADLEEADRKSVV